MWLTAVWLSNIQVFIGPERRSAVAVLPYVRPIPGKLLPTAAIVFPTFKNFSSPKIIKDSNKISHSSPILQQTLACTYHPFELNKLF
jgi:hypothetical protein